MMRAVWAQSRTAVIGREGALPWHLPEDLAYFRKVTQGAPVVMGRRTWDSLPQQYRPLPGRRNIVLTRAEGWSAPGAETASSPDEAIALAGQNAWVIGGAQVYAALLPEVDLVEVTEVDLDVEGDALAPDLNSQWQRVVADPPEGWHESSTGTRYRFLSYVRISPDPD